MHSIVTLSNGIRVVMEKLDHIHSVCIGVWIGVGSCNENSDEIGLSHFIEHMVFKGTKNRTAKQIAEEVDNIGAQLNAFTGKNCTCYYIKALEEDLDTSLDILNDLVYNPIFDSDELEKERGVILEEIAMSQDEPEDLLADLAAKAQYKGSLSNPILGTKKLIKGYSSSNLKQYWQNHYTPKNIVISVIGNFNNEELLQKLNYKFNGLNCTNNENLSNKNKLIFKRKAIDKDIEQTHIQLGFAGYDLFSSKSYTLNLLNVIIGGGMSSRLFQRIREELGLAYTVASYTDNYTGIGSFNIYAATSPNNVKKVIDEINIIINDIKALNISDKEFNSAKVQLKANLLMGLESSSSRMNFFGKDLLIRGCTKTSEEIIQAINDINKDNLHIIINECFNINPALSLVGPNATKLIDNINFI